MGDDENDDIRPECFGSLETVFPLGENGLRESPAYCMYSCPFKTECLKKAMNMESPSPASSTDPETSGTTYKETKVYRFIERWSRTKSMKNNPK